MINIGPSHDGRIIPIQEERLRQLGDWLKVNGEAIYGTTYWTHQNDTITPGVWLISILNNNLFCRKLIFISINLKGLLQSQKKMVRLFMRLSSIGPKAEKQNWVQLVLQMDLLLRC